MKKTTCNSQQPRLLPEEMPTMMLVNSVSKLFHDKLRNLSEQMGIPEGYRHILFMLAHGDGKTQFEISQMTHLKAPTVSVALQKMEAEGLVTRRTDDQDQRQSIVCITEKGMEMHKKLKENLITSETVTLQSLTADEEVILRSILIKMRASLVQDMELNK